MNKNITFISIPKGLPSVIVKDNKELKMLVVYYQLKSLYVGGIIHNYTKKYDIIAENFNISNSKLRNYIKILLKMGWVYKQNKSLVIRSKKMLSTCYGVSKYCYKIKINVINDLENVIKMLALTENQERQKFLLLQKMVSRKLKSEGRTSSSNYVKESKYEKLVKRQVKNNLDNLIEKEKERLIEIAEKKSCFSFIEEFKKINPFITNSRLGISQILNRKSKSTGSRTIKKLSSLNYILEDKVNKITIDKNKKYKDIYIYNELLLDKYNKFFYIEYYRGKITLRLSNTVKYNTNPLLMN